MTREPPPHLGLTSHTLAAKLLELPDMDVVMENVADALLAADIQHEPPPDAKDIPLQRVAGIKIGYVQGDIIGWINQDIHYHDAPKEGWDRPVLRILGVNTEELTD